MFGVNSNLLVPFEPVCTGSTNDGKVPDLFRARVARHCAGLSEPHGLGLQV